MPALSKACFLLWFSSAAAVGFAQSRDPDDSWWTRNYHFTGPPAPELQPENPVVVQLREVQNTILSIMRKADFAWDFETALFAAAQAAANARLIGMVTGELKPAQPPQPPRAPRDQPPPEPAKYLIVFQDGSVQPAIAVWTDRLMLHYLTPEGAHGQVRRELIDWKRSAGLNPPDARIATEPDQK